MNNQVLICPRTTTLDEKPKWFSSQNTPLMPDTKIGVKKHLSSPNSAYKHVFRDRTSIKCCYCIKRGPAGYQKHILWFAYGGCAWVIFFPGEQSGQWTKTKVKSDTEKTFQPTKYEHNSSLRVDLLDTFADLDDNIWLFDYRVSPTKIKLGAFIFVVIFSGASPAAHLSGKSPKHVKIA